MSVADVLVEANWSHWLSILRTSLEDLVRPSSACTGQMPTASTDNEAQNCGGSHRTGSNSKDTQYSRSEKWWLVKSEEREEVKR